MTWVESAPPSLDRVNDAQLSYLTLIVYLSYNSSKKIYFENFANISEKVLTIGISPFL